MKITSSRWFIFVALWLLGNLAGKAAELTVRRDGSGQYQTIREALAAVPKKSKAAAGERWILRLEPGIYREKLTVPKDLAPVTLVGEDRTGTVLTGEETVPATVVLADDFGAENVTFQNGRGAGGAAVALQVAGDRAFFRHCHFLGWQETLLLEAGRHYFVDCLIEGTTDFILGGATAYFEHCELHALGSGSVTAAATPEEQRYGFVFAGCRISTDKAAKVLLGRPGKPHASVTFLKLMAMEGVPPEGWSGGDDSSREKTVRFAEFPRSSAEGALAGRAPWARRLTPEEAKKITPAAVIGGADHWDPAKIPTMISPVAAEWGMAAPRIAALPEGERGPWEEYLRKSEEAKGRDRAVLAEEVKAAGLAEVRLAPGPENYKAGPKPAEWYGSPEAVALAEAMVSFQTPSGGWAKAVDYAKGARQPGMHWFHEGKGEAWNYIGTIDNYSTTYQVATLAAVFRTTQREAFRDAAVRGLQYLLAAQFPSGGWPQVYPLCGGYHDAITYNDDAMVHVLELLQRVAEGDAALAFASPLKEAAAAAVAKGVACLLKSQCTQNGTKAVWCAQHDPMTLQPVSARLKEPASLSGGESMAILRFLMRRGQPGAGEKEAIEAGLAWFERSQLTGWRPIKKDGRNLWEQAPTATEPMWARFNDLHTNQPIFAGAQDGIVYDSFETMARNNLFGYAFFTPKPQELLGKEQAKWRGRK